MMRTRSSGRVHATGQSMVEFVIIVPVLLLLIFGILQFAQIYIAKSTLDLAAYDGVRAGTLNNAKMDAIKCGIAQGLLPLYGGTDTPSQSGLVKAAVACGSDLVGPPRYIAAFSKAFAAVDNPQPTAKDPVSKAVDYGAMEVEILNPTTQAFADWGETINNQLQIPNDRLMWRDTSVGNSSGETVQDANLLMIRVRYCYTLSWVFGPIVESLAFGATQALPREELYSNAPHLTPSGTFATHCYGAGGIVLSSTSTMLMQSPAYPSP